MNYGFGCGNVGFADLWSPVYLFKYQWVLICFGIFHSARKIAEGLHEKTYLLKLGWVQNKKRKDANFEPIPDIVDTATDTERLSDMIEITESGTRQSKQRAEPSCPWVVEVCPESVPARHAPAQLSPACWPRRGASPPARRTAAHRRHSRTSRQPRSAACSSPATHSELRKSVDITNTNNTLTFKLR